MAPLDGVECLRPKILLNLGITLELEDCLPQACDSYRCVIIEGQIERPTHLSVSCVASVSADGL